jgi:hypothetical protein
MQAITHYEWDALQLFFDIYQPIDRAAKIVSPIRR